MKNKTLTAILTGLLIASAAHAEETKDRKWYIGGHTGITITPDLDYDESSVLLSGTLDNDTTVNFGAAVGYHVTPNMRAEFELSYRDADFDADIDQFPTITGSGSLKTWTGLINGYYDFREGKNLRPYVSAGIGFARHEADLSLANIDLGSETDTVFAYQLGTGLSYDIGERTALFTGYRYLGSSDPEYDTFETEYNAHEVNVGVRYRF